MVVLNSPFHSILANNINFATYRVSIDRIMISKKGFISLICLEQKNPVLDFEEELDNQ